MSQEMYYTLAPVSSILTKILSRCQSGFQNMRGEVQSGGVMAKQDAIVCFYMFVFFLVHCLQGKWLLSETKAIKR